jgi:hypothetical protein
MKTTDIYEASTLARSVSNSLAIAVAFKDAGHDADAAYKFRVAEAAFASLADQLGYRIEPIADPARVLAYIDAGQDRRAEA